MTFKSSIIFLLIAIILLGLGRYFYDVSLWWLLLPVLLFNTIVILGSRNIRSNFHIKTYSFAVTEAKEIAITFDDGPDAEFTPQILKILADYQVPAAFFVIGKNVKGNEKILQDIDSAGHIIGNHTFSHTFFIDFKSKKRFIRELNQTMETVYKATGRHIKLFRPPYGVTTPNLASASRDLDYTIVGWNVRSMDTTDDNEEEIMKLIKKKMKPGAVILFHDTSTKTVNVLKQTLDLAKENGFKIVSVEELLKVKAYEF